MKILIDGDGVIIDVWDNHITYTHDERGTRIGGRYHSSYNNSNSIIEDLPEKYRPFIVKPYKNLMFRHGVFQKNFKRG